MAEILQFQGLLFVKAPELEDVLTEVVTENCYHLDRIPHGTLIIDVGALYGEFGLYANLSKNCPVIAYEPSRNNCAIAALNEKLNSPVNYTLINKAVSGLNETALFTDRPDHPGGSRVVGEVNSYDVDCVSMASVIADAVSKYPNTPIMVKLDCEGSEVDIFNGELNWLDKVSYIAMEWHCFDGHVYRDILQARGFTVELEGSGPLPRPAWDKTIAGGLLFAVKNQPT